MENAAIRASKAFYLGPVRLKNRVVAAPMAGVSNLAFRLLAAEMGAGLVVSEMVSDQALIHESDRTMKMLRVDPRERPVAVQLFGGSPETMAQAARIIEERGPDLIDVNMGCPAPKVVKGGGGSALLRDLPLAGRIIEAVVTAVKVPVTVKMRTGWDSSCLVVEEAARIAESAGAVAVTVHGRTRVQQYTGQADWGQIARAVRAVSIPIIGNGDIWEPRDSKRMLDEAGCAAVAIGRGSLGNPWLFQRTVRYLETGEELPGPTPQERVRVALRHLDMLVELKGEYTGVREMRKHAAWYTRGLPGAALIRGLVMKAGTRSEMAEIISTITR